MKANLFTKIFIGLSVAIIATAGLAIPAAASLESGVRGGADAARGSSQPSQLFGDGGIFQQVTNILLFLIGVLSVIMLIIGGLRYVVSGGNKDAVNSAKNTILYAIVGLITALLAYAAVDFVINVFSGGGFNNTGTNI